MSAKACWHPRFVFTTRRHPAIADDYLWHLGRKDNGSWPDMFATRSAAYSYRSATDGSTLIAFRAGK